MDKVLYIEYHERFKNIRIQVYVYNCSLTLEFRIRNIKNTSNG